MKLIDIKFNGKRSYNEVYFDATVETGFWFWRKRRKIKLLTETGIVWYSVGTGREVIDMYGLYFHRDLQAKYKFKMMQRTLWE